MEDRNIPDIEDCAPREPRPEECCGSGCPRCVWDIYFEALEAFKNRRVKASSVPVPRSSQPESALTDYGQVGSRHGSVVIRYCDDFEDEPEEDPVSSLRHRGYSSTCCDIIRKSDGGLVLGSLRGLRLSSLCRTTPEPGCTVDILAENSSSDVLKLLERLGVPSDRKVRLMQSPFAPPNSFPPWLPKDRAISTASLFQYYIDISSLAVVRSPGLWKLIESHCQIVPSEKEAASSLEAMRGSALQGLFAGSLPSLYDVLEYFPSTVPPLARLLEVLPSLRERKFSIANDPLNDVLPEIVFREVIVERSHQFSLAESHPGASLFYGHATKRLASSGTIWCRPSINGVIPGQSTFVHALQRVAPSIPVMLVAGGAGIAPLRAFLQRRSRSVPATGQALLFFATRHASEVRMFEDEFAQWKISGLLQSTYFAVSRDQAAEHQRIDSLITAHKGEISKLLSFPDSRVVACGPQGMLDCVRGHLSPFFESQEALDGRLLIEKWSNSAAGTAM